jgi:hypothetical protein
MREEWKRMKKEEGRRGKREEIKKEEGRNKEES